MTASYPFPATQEYVDSVLAKVNARPPDEWWIEHYDAPYIYFGYRQKERAGINHSTWWERVEELGASNYMWPIPWDVATYEALDMLGLWPHETQQT